MLYMTPSFICLLALLGTISHAVPTPLAPAAGPAASALTVTIRNSKGSGTLQLTFSEKPAAAFPATFFTVLGGLPAPQFTTVQVTSKAKGFPTDQKFSFHIHEAPVDSTGNCSSTKGHWDPLQAHPKFRGGKPEDYKPTPGNWSTFELGDLTGKYGAVNGPANATLLLSNFVVRKRDAHETEEELVVVDPTLTKLADFAKLSVVVHDGAGARVGCGNFEVVEENDADDNNLTEPGHGKRKKNKCSGKKKVGGY